MCVQRLDAPMITMWVENSQNSGETKRQAMRDRVDTIPEISLGYPTEAGILIPLANPRAVSVKITTIPGFAQDA